MKKLFNSIEIIIVIAVLGVLISIIFPNIAKIQSNAITSSVNSSISSLQIASDQYAIENNGKYPTTIQPTLGKPQLIDFDLIYPNYTKNLPNLDKIKGQKYWVDFEGQVWGATVSNKYISIFKQYRME